MDLKPDVDAFGEIMLIELLNNKSKGDKHQFVEKPVGDFVAEIRDHADKLSEAIRLDDALKVQEHAADIANFAMMALMTYKSQKAKVTP